MANKIYVGRISSTTTEKQLFDHFSQIGKVIITATIVPGINPNEHSGHGYIVMSGEKEAQTAISKLNNSLLGNSRIHVVQTHYLDQEKKQYYSRRY